MKYDVILCDFDGTLCHDDVTLSDYTVSVVREYVKRGGIFIICSGRMDVSVRKYVKQLGTDKQRISAASLQGAVILDSAGNLLYHEPVPYEQSLQIVKELEKTVGYLHVYDRDHVLIVEEDPISTAYRDLCNVNLKEVGKLSDYIEQNKLDCGKILAVIDPAKKDEIFAHFDELKIPGVKYFMASRTYFEFVSKRAGKEVALRKIGELLGVPTERIMAFGDNGNDVEMIKAAGFGVAVANAREEVRACADYVCPSNNEDGVAQTIEKICLNGETV